MSYWLLIKPFLKYIIPLLAGLVIGAYIMNKIDDITIDKLKYANTAYETADFANQNTIKELNERIIKQQDSCDARLKNKDNVINKLKKIDNLKPGAKDEKDHDDTTIIGSLNSMWPKDNQ